MNKKLSSILAMLLLITSLMMFLIPTNSFADTRTKGSLTIVKKTDDNTKPIRNAEFTVYKVDDDSEDPDMDVTGLTAVVDHRKTNTSGEIIANALEVGRYLVIETTPPNEAIEVVENFFVDIPQYTVVNGVIEENYDVIVYPKNKLGYSGVTLTTWDNTDPSTDILLPGVEFDFYYKAPGASDYTRIESITNVDGTSAQIPNSLVTDGTNAKIETSNLPVGDYKFVMTDVPTGGYIKDETAQKFSIVNEEVTDAEGNTVKEVHAVNEEGTVITNIDVYLSKPTVEKTVSDADKVVALGQEVTFTIDATVPTAQIARMKTFKVIDTYGYGYEVDETTVAMNGNLTLGTDYTVANENGVMTIEFTTVGKGKLANIADLQITYTATIGSVSEFVGGDSTAFSNEAKIQYSTVVADPDEPEDPTMNDDPTVTDGSEVDLDTYGVKVLKVDGGLLAGSAPLANAEFQISKSNTADANGNPTAPITAFDGTTDTDTFVSDANGVVKILGLEPGTYYLFETKAPTYTDADGVEQAYVKLNAPKEITVNVATSDIDTVTGVEVKNNKPSVLPATGAVCTAGLVILGGAMAIYGYKLLKRD